MTTPDPVPDGAPTTRIHAWKVIVPVVLVIAGAAGALSLVKNNVKNDHASESAQGGAFEMRVGATLPDIDLPKLGGKGTIKLSQVGSKVTLINFWATWCEACMVEMPTLVKLRETYKAKGFEIAAINADENPDAVVPRTLADLKMGFPVFVDPEGKLADVFDVHAIPLTVIVDSQRKILMIETGERDWFGADVRELLEKWLG